MTWLFVSNVFESNEENTIDTFRVFNFRSEKRFQNFFTSVCWENVRIWITWQQRILSIAQWPKKESILVHWLIVNGNFHQCISITVRYVALFNHSSRFFPLHINTQEHWIYFVSKIICPFLFMQHFSATAFAFTLAISLSWFLFFELKVLKTYFSIHCAAVKNYVQLITFFQFNFGNSL